MYSALCLLAAVLILAFGVERAFDSSLFADLSNLPLIDLGFLTLFLLVPILLLSAWHFSRPARAEHVRLVTQCAVSLCIVVALGAAYLVYQDRKLSASTTASLGIASAAVAAIGWLFQRQAGIDISRKQHTLNILVQVRQNDRFNRHRLNVFSRYPSESLMAEQDAVQFEEDRKNASLYGIDENGQEKYPVIESIQYICNYYEFISAAVYHGDIDDSLLKGSIGHIMCLSYDKFSALITMKHQKDKRGDVAKNCTYYYYWWLIKKRWKYKGATNSVTTTSPAPPQDHAANTPSTGG